MKKYIVVILVALCNFSFSQSKADFFDNKDYPVTWLGIDFSRVKLVGRFNQFLFIGKKAPEMIGADYFNRWNQMVLDDPIKYNFKLMLRQNEVINDVSMITAVNAATNFDSLSKGVIPNYSLEDLQGFINQYPIENKTGFGFLMIAESLNKNQKSSFFHVVLINMATKEILFSQRIQEKPAGFGIENYWETAIGRTLSWVKGVHYNRWKASLNN